MTRKKELEDSINILLAHAAAEVLGVHALITELDRIIADEHNASGTPLYDVLEVTQDASRSLTNIQYILQDRIAASIERIKR